MTTTGAQQPTQQLRVPDRPKLAPDTHLRGQMTESAFEDPPWLIDRGGTFVMVPHILYEVAAAANGDRTHAEVAAVVSEKTKRGVAAEHIHLLAGRLMLMG